MDRRSDIHLAIDELSKLCTERNTIQNNKVIHIESILATVATTQGTISDTQKCMSESISVITKFIKKYEPHLEIIESVVNLLRGIKIAIIWLAAILGGMSVIVTTSAIVWLYLTTSVQLEDFILK